MRHLFGNPPLDDWWNTARLETRKETKNKKRTTRPLPQSIYPCIYMSIVAARGAYRCEGTRTFVASWRLLLGAETVWFGCSFATLECNSEPPCSIQTKKEQECQWWQERGPTVVPTVLSSGRNTRLVQNNTTNNQRPSRITCHSVLSLPVEASHGSPPLLQLLRQAWNVRFHRQDAFSLYFVRIMLGQGVTEETDQCTSTCVLLCCRFLSYKWNQSWSGIGLDLYIVRSLFSNYSLSFRLVGNVDRPRFPTNGSPFLSKGLCTGRHCHRPGGPSRNKSSLFGLQDSRQS